MKRFTSILLTLLLLAGLAACGGTASQTPESAPPTEPSGEADTPPAQTDAADGYITEDPVTLEVWVGPAWMGVWDQAEPNAQYGDFHRYVAEEYTKLHPNVTINVETVDSTTRVERLTAAIQSGTLPNIVFDSVYSIYDYAHAGLLDSFNDVISDEDYADFPDSVWESVSTNGEVYAYPFNAETGHLAVNMDILEQAGALELLSDPDADIISWTPDEFRAVLEAVRDAKLDGVYPLGFYCASSSGDTWTNMYMRMFGSDFFSEDSTSVTLNDAAGVQAMQYMVDLYNDGLMAPGPESLKLQDNYNLFFAGQTAVAEMGNIAYGNLEAGWEDGSVKPFRFKWAYFPSDHDPFCFFYVKGSICFTAEDPVEQAVAKDFVRFYSSAPYTDASNALTPIRNSIIEKMTDADDIALANSLANAVNFSSQVPGYQEIRSVFYPEVQAAILGQKTAQEAMDDFAANANAALEKNVAASVLLK